MKFSHSLKFSAVPEWQDNYLNYTGLKKVIYVAQQNQLENGQPQDGSVTVNNATITELVRIARRNQAILDRRDAMAHANEEESLEKFTASKFINKFKQRKNAANAKTTPSPEPSLNELEKGEVTVEKDDVNDIQVTYSFDNDESTYRGSIDLDAMTAAAETISSESSDPLPVFAKHLVDEVTKIDKFFKPKEVEVYKQYDNLIKDLEANKQHVEDYLFTDAYGKDNYDENEHRNLHIKSTLERTLSNASVFDTVNHLDYEDLEKGDFMDEEEDDDDDDEDDHDRRSNSALLGRHDFNIRNQKQITLKQRSIHMFITLSELKSFIELNRIGFTKICKKFDKTCNYSVKEDFVANFLPHNSRAFFPETSEILDDRIDHVVRVYAFLSGKAVNLASPEDLEPVKDELRTYLRDHIVWERNTVWKDLLSIEKKQFNLNLDESAARNNKMGDEANSQSLLLMRWRKINMPFGWSVGRFDYFKVPEFIFSTQIIKLAIIIPVFIVLLTVKTMNDKEEARCLAVLAACAMLWASEALPLWVTSLLVPLLVVTCKVLKNEEGTAMDAADASKKILSAMWSSTLMILLGGFTLAAALSKYNIAKIVSSYMLALAGTKPRNILLAIMSVSLFLSMWISNVAAPVLAYSLIQPVLRTLPTTSPLSQALVLGIALASNLGGMASPIASPQNVIAIEYMDPNPGWGKWFAIALPVAILSMGGIWMELIMTFKISQNKVKAYKPIKERFTVKQWYISIVCIATILLWCVLSEIEDTFGSAGIIAVVPIVLFFGTGLLKVDDVNNFPWTIILLAMGGLALGSAVTSSGLLATVAKALQEKVADFDAFVVLAIFGILVLVVATFVSHTVATIIIVPLVKEVGDSMSTPHPSLLIMGTALMASAAMGLPTSGFPNVTAISMTDEVGQRYISVNTFITRGVPASLIAYVITISVGYGIMTCLDF